MLKETRAAEYFSAFDHGVTDRDGLIHWRGLRVPYDKSDHLVDRIGYPKESYLRVPAAVRKEIVLAKKQSEIFWAELAAGSGWSGEKLSAIFTGADKRRLGARIPREILLQVCSNLEYDLSQEEMDKWK